MCAIAARRIEEYAIIGDCVTAALINADGGIDWMCVPAFDGPSIFGALLDPDKGGDFVICPSIPGQVERGYVGDSAIFQTRFITGEGVVRLTDFFVVARAPDAGREEFSKLYPTRKLVRMVELESGTEVPMKMAVRARPDYGCAAAEWNRGTGGEFTLPQMSFSTNVTMGEPSPDLVGEWKARAGQCYYAVMDYGAERPVPNLADVHRWHAVTAKFWEQWGYFNSYRGIYERMVRRSAITLKLLTYAPSGVFVAAASTSLPEIAGGEANWDYRFAWVRDTTFFINTFSRVGYCGEGMAFLKFVIKKSMERKKKGQETVPVFYGLRVESKLEEAELKHLSGYLGSTPVRVGNRAGSQFQLDNFADILEAFFFYKHTGGKIGHDEMTLVREMACQLLEHWSEPDNGLWEEAEKRQLSYGKVAAWTSLMRSTSLSNLKDLNIQEACEKIYEEVSARGIRGVGENRYLASVFDSDEVDASCLLAFLKGFLPADVARRTREKIEQQLGEGPFIYRNAKLKEKGEGAFFLCMFWRIDHLIKEGEINRAERLLAETIELASPFGLLSEQIDPATRSFRGNFPQAFSHLGLIDTILRVDQAKRKPEMASLADHEKFTRTVGRTLGFWGTLLRLARNPKTWRLTWSGGGSKWNG